MIVQLIQFIDTFKRLYVCFIEYVKGPKNRKFLSFLYILYLILINTLFLYDDSTSNLRFPTLACHLLGYQ